MEPGDLDHVLELESRCQDPPWSADLFRRELENPLSRIDLIWIDDALAGYLCTWRIADELHIHNVATSPALRRRGVARELLQRALADARRQGSTRAFLEVRVGNAGAIALYRSLGFQEAGRRARYYADGEDALMMESILVPDSTGRESL